MTKQFTIARTAQDAAQLVAELERRQKSAHDFVADSKFIQFGIGHEPDQPRNIVWRAFGDALTGAPVSPTAHQQLASISNVPGEYSKRIYETAPGLWAQTYNTLLPKDKRLLLRQLDGRVRAVLSDRYRVLDNYDLFFQTFDVARQVGAEISRATLTDDRFELRLVVPSWREDFGYDGEVQEPGQEWKVWNADGRGGQGPRNYRIGGGSSIIPGVYVSNSETGRGGLNVKPFLFDAICSNTSIYETTLAQVHLGRALGEGALSRESAEADSRAIWLKVRDLVTAVFDREKFSEAVARFRATGELTLSNPVEAVDLIVANNGLTQDDRQAILNELVSPSHGRNAGGTVLGLLNAITQRAQAYEESDPEKATELEQLGGKLIERPRELVAVR